MTSLPRAMLSVVFSSACVCLVLGFASLGALVYADEPLAPTCSDCNVTCNYQYWNPFDYCDNGTCFRCACYCKEVPVDSCTCET